MTVDLRPGQRSSSGREPEQVAGVQQRLDSSASTASSSQSAATARARASRSDELSRLVGEQRHHLSQAESDEVTRPNGSSGSSAAGSPHVRCHHQAERIGTGQQRGHSGVRQRGVLRILVARRSGRGHAAGPGSPRARPPDPCSVPESRSGPGRSTIERDVRHHHGAQPSARRGRLLGAVLAAVFGGVSWPPLLRCFFGRRLLRRGFFAGAFFAGAFSAAPPRARAGAAVPPSCAGPACRAGRRVAAPRVPAVLASLRTAARFCPDAFARPARRAAPPYAPRPSWPPPTPSGWAGAATTAADRGVQQLLQRVSEALDQDVEIADRVAVGVDARSRPRRRRKSPRSPADGPTPAAAPGSC